MDPTQNKDSFDSFGPGGNNSGGIAGGQANPMASGNQMASGNPMAPTGLNQVGGVDSAMPVSSGTGDIVIGGASENKPKKGLVIGLIIVVLLIVTGVAIWVMMGRQGGSGGQNGGGATDLKSAFNSYANYVLLGKDSVEDLSEEDLDKGAYFETANLSGDELNKYLENTDKKYDDLGKEYVSDTRSFFNMLKLYDFYQEYARVKPLTIKEISDSYYKDGENAAEDLIKSRYSVSESVDSDFANYLDAVRQFDEVALSVIKKADDRECVLNDSLQSSCYVMSEDEKDTLADASMKVFETSSSIRSNAFLALEDIYDSIYNSNILTVNDEERNSE